jgi:hypothetical protein
MSAVEGHEIYETFCIHIKHWLGGIFHLRGGKRGERKGKPFGNFWDFNRRTKRLGDLFTYFDRATGRFF